MIYRGKVISNDSPTNDGRVKVRIFEIHGLDETIPDNSLPWAEVMQGIDFIGFYNNKPGIGRNTIIEVGTWVFCVLDHNNPNMPIVIGTVAAENEINNLSNPKNQVLETVSGHLIEIDDNSGNERIHIKHKSGTRVLIKPDGSIEMNVVGSVKESISGNQNTTASTIFLN